MPKISVIVPVYKAEKYLDRCVRSILGQTYSDFELILVDDDSPDRSGEMCEAYAAADPRIRVLHKQNGGAGAARNTALDVAGGEYILFVDSDDYILPTALEKLLTAAQDNGTKISICGYCVLRNDREGVTPSASDRIQVWTGSQMYSRRTILATVPWAKLYHRSCWEGVRYPAIRYGEDEFVTYRMLFDNQPISVLDDELYVYFSNEEGMVQSAWSEVRLPVLQAYEEQIAFLEQQGEHQMRAERLKAYLRCVISQMNATKTRPEYRQHYKLLKRRGKKLLRRCLQERLISPEDELWMCAAVYPRLIRIYSLTRVALKKLGLVKDKGSKPQ